MSTPEPVADHADHDLHGLLLAVLPDGSVQIEDEDCDCPPDCDGCETEGVLRPERDGADS